MDRYLYKNLEDTLERRANLKILKNTKKELEERIEYLNNFKGKNIAVTELLSNVIQFLEEQRGENSEFDQLFNGIKNVSDKVQKEIIESDSLIKSFNNDMDNIFHNMSQYHYRLHAVLVHDGVALIGHYWAYIFDRQSNKWFKYNDITVEEVTEESVLREAKGHSKTSAYCLIYLRVGEKSPIAIQNAEIPKDLLSEIEKDNKGLVTENGLSNFI